MSIRKFYEINSHILNEDATPRYMPHYTTPKNFTENRQSEYKNSRNLLNENTN